jgi:hypothetical protein
LDEIDILNEAEPRTVRREVRSATFQTGIGPQPEGFPFEELREGLSISLRSDPDVVGPFRNVGDEPTRARALSVAVDGPTPCPTGSVYQVRMEFGPGQIDRETIREVIADTVWSELKLLTL